MAMERAEKPYFAVGVWWDVVVLLRFVEEPFRLECSWIVEHFRVEVHRPR